MMLSFWSTREPIRLFTSGQVNSAYVARQFAAWLVFVFLVEAIDATLSGANSLLSYYQAIVSTGVSIAGVAYCLWRSGTWEFVTRFSVIALPVSVQLAVTYEVFYWGAYLIYPVAAFNLNDTYYEGIWLTFDWLLPLTFTAAWYLRMAQLMVKMKPGS